MYGLWFLMAKSGTLNAKVFSGFGWSGCLLVEILLPALLASVFNLSLALILSVKAVLHLDGLKCSILTFIFFGIILFLTCLFTTTPALVLFKLKIFPVFP